MINPNLNVNKAFRDQVKKYLNTAFVALTQPFIKPNYEKNKCFSIIISHETRVVKPKQFF